MERSAQLRKLTTMGMMAAVSIILVYLIHFPIFPAAIFPSSSALSFTDL